MRSERFDDHTSIDINDLIPVTFGLGRRYALDHGAA